MFCLKPGPRFASLRPLISCSAVLALLVLCFAWTPRAVAATAGVVVKDVRLTGNRTIQDQIIKTQLRVKVGQAFVPSDVQRDIRRLFELGYFSDIKADVREEVDGIIVEYILTERKLIRDIVIVGNRNIRTREIAPIVNIRRGETYIPGAYRKDQDAILTLYRSKGFANAKVDLRVRDLSRSQVELVYTIHEGTRVKVRSVVVLGNEALTDRQIAKVMQTRPPRFFFFGGNFREDVFQQDLQRVLDAYADAGHIDAAILETHIDPLPNDNRWVTVTLVVSEGPEYVIDGVAVEGNEVWDDATLIAKTESRVGDVYNKGQVEADAGAINTFYGDRGYIQAIVDTRLDIDREQYTISVTYTVQERELMYVGRIIIRGNTKTKDTVIRREVTLQPGERFDGSKLRNSQRRLQRTEYFSEVNIDTERTDEPNVRDLVFTVKEQRTGQFNFGAGFSTNDSLIGSISVQQSNFDLFNPPNFTGGGQNFLITAQPGTLLSTYRLSFRDPYAFGYPVVAGFDLFWSSRDFDEYDQQVQGVQVEVGKRVTDYTTLSLLYTYQQVDISDVDVMTAPASIISEVGRSTKSSLTLVYTTDTRDNVRFPTDGYRHKGSIEYAGLGGSADFVKLLQQSEWYQPWPWNDEWTLLYAVSGGVAFVLSGDNLPLYDRFFAGGTGSVRGYDFRDVGPRVMGDPIGGQILFESTVELSIPLLEVVYGHIFFDAGQVWEDFDSFGDDFLKFGTGIGFSVITPLGPLRFDYGIPINPDDDQGSGQVHISTGLRF